jgi:uncharacterized protein YdeI (YjbR/CyaY-like superfamily)
MGARDPRVDAYIAKSADFAKPILEYLRELVHATCPNVEETLKWRSPTFMYKGMLCGMAAFKQHCTFGFWKGALIVPGSGDTQQDAMGQFGRITKLKDLPPKKVIVGFIKDAMRLNDEGVKTPRQTSTKPRVPLEPPTVLVKALARNAKARATFEKFSPSNKRDYIEWIVEAKTDATRERRLATAIEWMAEGKPRNWKYMNC